MSSKIRLMRNSARFLIPCISALCLAGAATSYAATESWYWGFGLGSGAPGYSGSTATTVSELETKNLNRFVYASDLHFYWPLANPSTLLGVAGGGISDSFSTSGNSGSFTVTQSSLAASLLHTLGDEPGVGPILRADVGLAVASASVSALGFSLTGSTDIGFGFRAGGGYGFSLSDTTRLLVQGSYALRFAGSNTWREFAITVGPLF